MARPAPWRPGSRPAPHRGRVCLRPRYPRCCGVVFGEESSAAAEAIPVSDWRQTD